MTDYTGLLEIIDARLGAYTRKDQLVGETTNVEDSLYAALKEARRVIAEASQPNETDPRKMGSLDRVRAYAESGGLGRLSLPDVEFLVAEVDAVREYRGNFAVAHRRYTDAGIEAAQYKRQVEEQATLIETFQMGADMPLWRRIAMQRRALRVMSFQVSMYQRRWQKALNELKELRSGKDA